VEAALDLIYERLMQGDEPVMARLEREMIARSEKADPATAAKKLGVTKADLERRSRN
jgi:hypothetical protein